MNKFIEALLPIKEAPLQTPTQNYEIIPWLFANFHPVIDIMNEKDVQPGETLEVTLYSIFTREEIGSETIYKRKSEESYTILK